MEKVFRLIGLLMIGILALLLLAGCSGDGSAGSSTSSFRLTAQAAGVGVPENKSAQATPAPTLAPQVVYKSVEKLATVIVRETVEVTVYLEATPDIAGFAVQSENCDTLRLTPMPTIALDAGDIAAGVVLRGQYQPCAYETAIAHGVQP